MDFQHRLPPELWTMMLSERFNWPPRNDIKNVRLTCKLFEKFATQFLLSRILCAPLSNQMTTLTTVSLHPILNKSVKEVVYICNRYQLFETLLEYKEALRGVDSLVFPYEPKSKEENL